MKAERYFRDKVREYYINNGRDFFWRHKKLTPFQVMLTELFLKKTRAGAVEKHVFNFLKEFPSSEKILQCKNSVLLKKVQPLGLGQQRTNALKKATFYLKNHFKNRLPSDIDEISKIPYVGLYTANATICFGFNKRSPILDVNTSRIISRFFSIKNNLDLRDNDALQDKARELLPRNEFKEYNWGLLDIGAMICKTTPLCFKCPLQKRCQYCLNHGKALKDERVINKMGTPVFTYIDIFSGCGGMSLGLYKAGWTGLFAIEKNSMAFETLKHNLIDKKKHFRWPSWLPVKEHDINEVLKNYGNELGALKGKVDLVVGGPPCQGFSTAGKRNEGDKRNKMVDSYVKFIDIVRPKILFFENVKGFTMKFSGDNSKGEAYSSYVLKELGKLGYNVHGEIIDFSRFGIPQRRKRFILVGMIEGDPAVFFKKIVANKIDFLNKKSLRSRITASQALSDLKKTNREIDSIDFKHFKEGLYSGPRNNYQKLLREGLNRHIPDSHRFPNHDDKTISRFQYILKKCPRDSNIDGKIRKKFKLKKRWIVPMDGRKVSPTLTTLPDDYIHYCEPRILTVREYARLQSFDDWFEFRGKYTTGGKQRCHEVPRYTQVGNAIPPLFGEQSGMVLKELLLQ